MSPARPPKSTSPPEGSTIPRLLNINNYHYRRGGADVVYLEHGAMFQAQGWDCDWFSMKHPRNPAEVDDSRFAELIDMEHFTGQIDRVRAAGAIIYNFDARAKLAKVLDAARPDMAHLHNIYHHLSPSILPLLKSRGIPVVMTAHDLKLLCPAYKMIAAGKVCEACRGGRTWNVVLNRCMKGSLALSSLIAVESTFHRASGIYRRNLDMIVAPSRFYADKFVEWGWPADRVVHIPNFVDLPATPPTPVPQTGPLLYMGRLSEEKGLATLIHAATQANVPVAIAGTGPEEANLKALAAALDAPVEFLGYRAGADLQATVAAARAIVLPSEWYENAPMSVLEAHAAGRPVIGAAIGGIPELIEHGETGWTFPSGDVAALAARLRMVADEPASRLSAIGESGRARLFATFSRERYHDAMDALYRRLM